MFAKNKRKGPLKLSTTGPRTLDIVGPVSKMFLKRYTKSRDPRVRIKLSANQVAKLLQILDWFYKERGKEQPRWENSKFTVQIMSAGNQMVYPPKHRV
jgi:hypothetical protein